MISYTWIPYFTGFVAFCMAYGIGANDVANAFATSVGAKAITLRTALCIAAVMEFSGAFLMGSQVTSTIAKNIIDPSVFVDQPEVLMVANMCALMSAAVWLIIATEFGMPVSTTHSIIGALVGCGIVAKGTSAINWKKVVEIVISWFTSPVLSGIFSFLLFLFVRNVILRAKNSFERSLKFYPILVAFCFFVNIMYVIYKGTPQLNLSKTPYWLGILISMGISLIIGFALYFIMVPRLRAKSLAISEEAPKPTVVEGEKTTTVVPVNTETTVTMTEKPEEKPKEESVMEKVQQKLSHDVHAELKDETSEVYKIHQHAEKFDARTEHVFSFIQVITATFDSFCHGANDVANSIGPFAGVIAIYNTREVVAKSAVPVWILALGGAGIVIGLATLGYKIMASIGVNLVRVTPSRGFTIEMGAAIVVLVGSGQGIPLSTTHCQVGSTVGVGCLEGTKGINWKLLVEVFVGWIVTMVVAGGLGAGIFYFAMGTPSMLVPFK